MVCGKVNVLFLVVLTVAILFVNVGKCEDETEEKSVEGNCQKPLFFKKNIM